MTKVSFFRTLSSNLDTGKQPLGNNAGKESEGSDKRQIGTTEEEIKIKRAKDTI